jgi:hypothetical protein
MGCQGPQRWGPELRRCRNTKSIYRAGCDCRRSCLLQGRFSSLIEAMAAKPKSHAGLATDDDRMPHKDASTAFTVDKRLSCVDWFIYEPVETMKMFDDENGGQVDPEQAHWDTIPLDWPADQPMRILLPLTRYQEVSHVITVPAPCTMKQILTSIYEFYQGPIEISELHALKSKAAFPNHYLEDGGSVWQMLDEGKTVRRFNLLGSTELFMGPAEGQRRCGLDCSGLVRMDVLSERQPDGTVHLILGS